MRKDQQPPVILEERCPSSPQHRQYQQNQLKQSHHQQTNQQHNEQPISRPPSSRGPSKSPTAKSPNHQHQQLRRESGYSTNGSEEMGGRKSQKKWTSAFRVVQTMTRFKNLRQNSQNSERNHSSNESTPSRTTVDSDTGTGGGGEVDPVYLALKQATERYGGGSTTGSRRSSSNMTPEGAGSQLHLDCHTPSPRNLSQVSLHDSGYSEFHHPHGGTNGRNRLLGSTPQLTNHINGLHSALNGTTALGAAAHQGGFNLSGGLQSTGPVPGRQRPKLSEKMKSLSLDCAEMPPPAMQSIRNGACKTRPMRLGQAYAAVSGESLDLGRSVSPPMRFAASTSRNSTPRRLLPIPKFPAAIAIPSDGSHVVIHEYNAGGGPECSLFLGDRMIIVDNGDPDWLHGFKANDRLEQLLTFPSTCVTPVHPGEQPMKLVHNTIVVESKMRFYRDQVVFAQAEQTQIQEGKILVRNEHGSLAYCPASHLMLL